MIYYFLESLKLILIFQLDIQVNNNTYIKITLNYYIVILFLIISNSILVIIIDTLDSYSLFINVIIKNLYID